MEVRHHHINTKPFKGSLSHITAEFIRLFYFYRNGKRY